jgi:hypothetical protein
MTVPGQVTNIEVIETRLKADHPGQRREFGYVVRYEAVDPQTGEYLGVNYVTYGTNQPTDAATVIDIMRGIIEAGSAL